MAATSSITLYDTTVATAGTTYTTPAAGTSNYGKGYETLQESWKNFIATSIVDYTSGTTLDVTIQHSPDATNWIDAVTFTQVTTADSNQHKAVVTSTVTNLLPYVRAKVVGVGSPINYVVTVKLWFENVK